MSLSADYTNCRTFMYSAFYSILNNHLTYNINRNDENDKEFQATREDEKNQILHYSVNTFAISEVRENKSLSVAMQSVNLYHARFCFRL